MNIRSLTLTELDALVGDVDDDLAQQALEEIDRRLEMLNDSRIAQAMGEKPGNARGQFQAPTIPAAQMTYNEKLRFFVDNHCVGRQYDSCVLTPCAYSGGDGCQHPLHPKNQPYPKDEG